MRKQIRGLNRGAKNINEGIDYCKVADGALAEMQDILQRMNELAIQAANGVNSDDDRSYISDEIDQLKDELERICTTTKYNDDYIFKTTETYTDYYAAYSLKFSGYPDNIYIYNDSYDETTKTATYGGVAYNGVRYAWSSISSTMYNADTNTFNEGTYTLKTDDGTWLTFTCTDGAEPPKVSCKYTMSASGSGISINGETIPWSEVYDESGEAIDLDYIEEKEYHFTYHGVTIKFTPEADDTLQLMTLRLSTAWTSNFKLTYEDTALYGNFDNTTVEFTSNDEVKNYLNSSSLGTEYKIRASSDGIWLECNSTTISDSLMTWADLGIDNWGDQSDDIWEDLSYTYIYKQSSENVIEFTFQLINETSMDSVIDALDGVVLDSTNAKISKATHAEATSTSGSNSNVLSVSVLTDNIKTTLAEEYGLGRDYTQTSDTFATSTVSYDSSSVSLAFSGTVDGVTTTISYTAATATAINTILSSMKSTINSVDLVAYLNIVAARKAAGATDATNFDLTSLVGTTSITGGGASTYLEDVYYLNAGNTNLITTGSISAGGLSSYYKLTTGNYAAASIDFSGLGTSYSLADLIGTGFNSTCQTCSNHYSVQFLTTDLLSTYDSNAAWSTYNDGSNSYNYCMVQSGNNWTLYVDVKSMKNNGISSGTNFTNTLVAIMDTAGFDDHYTQYATDSTDAKLYILDNRTTYASSGTSTATNADFSPYAYGTDMTASYTIKLSESTDSSDYVNLDYEYDFSELFDVNNLICTYSVSANGGYVYNDSSGEYELYDSSVHSATVTRYTLTSATLDTSGYNSLDDYLKAYITSKVLPDSLSSTTVSLVSDYTKYSVDANVNDNVAMVTEYDTPRQTAVYDPNELKDIEFLNIQCSSNANDFIRIQKQKLSLQKLGLLKLSVDTESKATKGISTIEKAMKKVNAARSTYGSYQNRLEHAYNINQNTAENTQSAESIIRDTDMANEMVKYLNLSILTQAGDAMIAQANQSKQLVLQMLA